MIKDDIAYNKIIKSYDNLKGKEKDYYQEFINILDSNILEFFKLYIGNKINDFCFTDYLNKLEHSTRDIYLEVAKNIADYGLV